MSLLALKRRPSGYRCASDSGRSQNCFKLRPLKIHNFTTADGPLAIGCRPAPESYPSVLPSRRPDKFTAIAVKPVPRNQRGRARQVEATRPTHPCAPDKRR